MQSGYIRPDIREAHLEKPSSTCAKPRLDQSQDSIPALPAGRLRAPLTRARPGYSPRYVCVSQDALVSVEARMTEYTQKELRVFESLKAAKAAAEDAISVRDRVLQRADALEGEVLELRSQLKVGVACSLAVRKQGRTSDAKRLASVSDVSVLMCVGVWGTISLAVGEATARQDTVRATGRAERPQQGRDRRAARRRAGPRAGQGGSGGQAGQGRAGAGHGGGAHPRARACGGNVARRRWQSRPGHAPRGASRRPVPCHLFDPSATSMRSTGLPATCSAASSSKRVELAAQRTLRVSTRVHTLHNGGRTHGMLSRTYSKPDVMIPLVGNVNDGQEAERSRDVAEQRAAANQRATQLAAQEWERQRLHLVATAAEAEQELQVR
jgi:hypothetical protein